MQAFRTGGIYMSCRNSLLCLLIDPTLFIDMSMAKMYHVLTAIAMRAINLASGTSNNYACTRSPLCIEFSYWIYTTVKLCSTARKIIGASWGEPERAPH